MSAVRWGVAGNIVVAWLLTLPAAAAIGAAVYGLTSLFGDGALGPVVVSLLAIAGATLLFIRNLQRGSAMAASG